MKNIILKHWWTAAILLPVIMGLLIFPLAHAQNQAPPPAPQNQSQLNAVLCNIVAYFFWIVILVSVIMVLFAAFTYVTARDDQEKTSKARRTLTYAAVGIAVALLAYGFPAIISGFFPTVGNFNFQCSGT